MRCSGKCYSRLLCPNLVHEIRFGLIAWGLAKAKVGHHLMRIGRGAEPNVASACNRVEEYAPMSLKMSGLRLCGSKSADHL